MPSTACIDEDALASYFDATLPPSEVASLFEHLDTCASCARLFAELAASRSIASTGGASASSDVATAETELHVPEPRARPTPHGLAENELLGGKYRIGRVLGSGGMGVVVEAIDEARGERVAIKLLLPAARDRPDIVQRFAREGRVAAKLRSEHVARVLDVGASEAGLPYLVMELLEGSDLGAILRERGTFPVREAVGYVLEAADGLAEAHEAGVVHRDLKPHNLFLAKRADGSSCVKVIDFGIAKLVDLGPADDVTQSAVLMGSPLYMAPEQMLSARDVDRRADIWSLGVILHAFITGSPPFRGQTIVQLYEAIQRSAPRLDAGRLDVPAGLADVVARCLERDRARRFDDVPALVRALAPFASDAPPLASNALPLADTTIARGSATLVSGDEGRAPAKVERASVEGPTTANVPATSRLAPARAPAASESPRPRDRRALLAFTALALVAGAGATMGLIRLRDAPIAAPSAAPVRAPLDAPDAVLACAPLEASGVEAPATWLGVAAADIACRHARWLAGGDPARVRWPAELLGIPRQPTEALAIDPYSAPDAPARMLEAARSSDARFAGRVVKSAAGFRVDLEVRDKGDRQLGATSAIDESLTTAVERAVDALATRGAIHRAPALDPSIATWLGFKSIETAFAYERMEDDPRASCSAMRERRADFGDLWWPYEVGCAPWADGGGSDAKHAIDRSSTAALALSVGTLAAMGGGAELEASANELAAHRAEEKSPFARAWLAQNEALVWLARDRIDRARSLLLLSVADDPSNRVAWDQLVIASQATAGFLATQRAAAAWAPAGLSSLQAVALQTSGQQRLSLTRRAFELEGVRSETGLDYARTLLELGRREEARAVGAAYAEGPPSNRVYGEILLAKIDASEAKIGAARQRLHRVLHAGVDVGAVIELAPRILLVGMVLGRAQEDADDFVRTVVAGADGWNPLAVTPGAELVLMAMCAQASRDVGLDGLARLERAHAAMRWTDTAPSMLDGARAYLRGDARAAAKAWVGLLERDIAFLLPRDAFDRAGRPELADRVDAKLDPFADFAGIAPSAPREAARLEERGDKTAARERAARIVAAWERADIDVAALERMRKLAK